MNAAPVAAAAVDRNQEGRMLRCEPGDRACHPRRWLVAAGILSMLLLTAGSQPVAAAATGSVVSARGLELVVVVAVAQEPTPAPGATPDPDTGPSDEPEPSGEPTPQPTQTPEPEEPTESPSAPEVPGDEPVDEPTQEPPGEGGDDDPVPLRQPTPPAAATANVDRVSVAIALAALVACGIVLWMLVRSTRRDSSSRAAPVMPASVPAPAAGGASSADTLPLMIAAGEALIDSGYPITIVRAALEDIAAVNGRPGAEVVAFPTALMVSLGHAADVETRAVSVGQSSLLLYQVEELDSAVDDARRGEVSPASSLRRIAEGRISAPPFGTARRLAGYVILSVGLSAVLGASMTGIAVAAALGLAIGGLMLLGARISAQYRAVVTVAAAFTASVVVLIVVRAGLDPGVLPSLVAPLVILLPGALLTIAVIELSTGHIMAGSARAAAGAMQLVLLAFGIAAGGALVGVPGIRLDVAVQPLGPAAPWIGVALFGVGLVLYLCARPASLGWILLVLYVAYGAQVLGDVVFGGVLSAFFGAIVMTPVAVMVARQPSGPPAIVSFLPAFWLLVPGALGLVGMTEILDGDTSGLATLVTTTSTMVAITLGVLSGLAIVSRVTRLERWWQARSR